MPVPRDLCGGHRVNFFRSHVYQLSELHLSLNVPCSLLLPGGGAKLYPGHKFYDTARLLVNLALDANDAGDFFPVSMSLCDDAFVSLSAVVHLQ